MQFKNRSKQVVAMLSATFIFFIYTSFPAYNINTNHHNYPMMARIDFGEMGENI
ncbi:MAG: hypothetical protein RR806_04360 [Oscillospiraceae bacterium]